MAPSLIPDCRMNLTVSTCLLSFCFVHCLCLDFTVAEKEEWYTAFVNITYIDPATSAVKTEKTECGRYGEHSPKREVKGQVLLPATPQDRQACDPNVRFPRAAQSGGAWVALVAAGNCSCQDKIRNVADSNSSAVLIYNTGNDSITMPHPDTADVVAVMIPEPKGRELVGLLEQGLVVTLHITVGTRNLQKYVSRTSVVFVSISFIVLMNISLAWLVFYYIQRFRYANARDRNQRRMGDAAKQAISKLQVRTLKKGDKEIEPDFENCAVCIECYQPNDVVRILPCRHAFHKHCVDPWLQDHRTCPMCKINILKALGIPFNADCTDDIPPDYEVSLRGPFTNPISAASEITVNESSVVLEPDPQMPHHYTDTVPQPDQSRIVRSSMYAEFNPGVNNSTSHPSGEHQPPLRSDLDTSALMSVERSDVDLSTEQECDEAKYRASQR